MRRNPSLLIRFSAPTLGADFSVTHLRSRFPFPAPFLFQPTPAA
jgi:hypothetical protein